MGDSIKLANLKAKFEMQVTMGSDISSVNLSTHTLVIIRDLGSSIFGFH